MILHGRRLAGWGSEKDVGWWAGPARGARVVGSRGAHGAVADGLPGIE